MSNNTDPEYRIPRLVSDISDYILFLSTEKNLSITIHQFDSLIYSFRDNLIAFNTHTLPYCRFLKRNDAVQKECTRRQKCLFSIISDEPFFGTCWAGVGEWVFPIPNPEGGGHAFVCVSGYQGDKQKASAQMRKISEQYDLSLCDMQRLHGELKAKHPPLEELRPIIQPLVHMVSLLITLLGSMNLNSLPDDTSSKQLYTRICQELHRGYNVNYSLEEIAAQFNCSVSHVSHLFSKHAHCSYRTYVNTVKTNIAKVYLTSTNMSIQEISEHLGFSNSNYFSTVFHRMCGVPPREFRQKLRYPAPAIDKDE